MKGRAEQSPKTWGMIGDEVGEWVPGTWNASVFGEGWPSPKLDFGKEHVWENVGLNPGGEGRADAFFLIYFNTRFAECLVGQTGERRVDRLRGMRIASPGWLGITMHTYHIQRPHPRGLFLYSILLPNNILYINISVGHAGSGSKNMKDAGCFYRFKAYKSFQTLRPS